jgi:branched-chain amino acid transport system permease protein
MSARPDGSGACRGGLLMGVLAMLAAAALLGALPYLLGPYWQQLGYRALQLLTLAMAWNLLAGYTGQVSLGTGAFVGLGAYAFALLGNASSLPLPLLLFAAGAVAAVFAILVSPGLFRLRGLYFTIGSLALAEALRILMVNLSAFGGASGIVLRASTPPFHVLYWLALLVALGAGAIVVGLLRSPASLALRAVRDDEDVARQMGVRSFRVKLATFALAGFLTGVVGGLQALKLGAIEPYGAFGMAWTIDTVAVVIIGGIATRGGPVVGTLLYVALGELLRDLPELHNAIGGLFLLLVIRLAPQGLWGLVRTRLAGRAASQEARGG